LIAVLIAERERLARGDGSLTLRKPTAIVARTLDVVDLREWIEVSAGFDGYGNRGSSAALLKLRR